MNIIQITTDGDHAYELVVPGMYMFYLENMNGSLVVDIQHKDIHVHILGLYAGSGSQSYQLKTVQKHSSGHSYSDVLIKGVFEDMARFEYEGLIRIEPGAHVSNAYLKNQNLVLGDEVFVDSRPYLEICADDVRCTHGSVTSGLSEAEKLYCLMRGIDEKTAEKVLVEGFKHDIKQKLADALHKSKSLGV